MVLGASEPANTRKAASCGRSTSSKSSDEKAYRSPLRPITQAAAPAVNAGSAHRCGRVAGRLLPNSGRLEIGSAKPSFTSRSRIVRGILAGVRQHDDVARAGCKPGEPVDGAGIGRDAIMQHAILVDEEEIESIRDGAQSVDTFHGAGTVPSALSASRATPTAASSCSDATTGTPRALARMRRQLSFAAPPPTVVTLVERGRQVRKGADNPAPRCSRCPPTVLAETRHHPSAAASSAARAQDR